MFDALLTIYTKSAQNRKTIFFPDRELQTCRYAGMAREAAIELHVFVYLFTFDIMIVYIFNVKLYTILQ